MIVLGVALALLAVVLLLPTVSDVFSVLYILLHRRPGTTATAGLTPRLLFLVPAHDEASTIEPCLRSLQALAYPHSRYDIVVVADNCTDSTADIARQYPIQVLERTDIKDTGKPYAIAWAIVTIDLSGYDALVIIDADTEIDPRFGQALAAAAPLRGKGIQGYNDVRNPNRTALTRMAFVLSTAYYRFMYPLKTKAGLNVPLTGPGMVIGIDVLTSHGWSAFSISEDVELYARLTLDGVPIQSLTSARVYVEEATSLRAGASQRQRWRGGRLTVLGMLAGQILRSKAIGFRQRLDLLAELAVPGPVAHLGVASCLAAVSQLLASPWRAWLSAAAFASLLRPMTYTALAIIVDPNPLTALRSFLFLPIYAVWRIATEVMSLSMVGEGRDWVRTRRERKLSGSHDAEE